VRGLRNGSLLVLLGGLLLVSGCGGGGGTPRSNGSTPSTAPAASRANVSLDKNAYPVFPNADAGADPAVPAEQGGKGFKGEGWQTNTEFDLIGDPRAVKGGVFREGMTDFPTTLRLVGPNVSVWNQTVQGLVYETLLGLHPTSLEYIPALATHWQVSPDTLTLRFRLDPNARFNDDTPVTSDDVVATWKLNVDKTLQDPFRNAMYSDFEQPVAESKYIVRVKSKKPGWTPLYYFTSMPIYPAHILKNINGAQYIKEYNDKMLPGTGPYFVTPADIDKGKTVRIRRLPNYWAEKSRRNIGTGNFDEIREVTVRDRNLEFEMVKRGDLDYYHVNRASMWVQELNFDKIQKGLLQKRKVWNHAPESIQGAAFNTRRPPYNDLKVRKALRLLYNRELMIEKLTFNEYMPQNSVFPGTIYENPNNEKIRFNPQQAVQLLAEAGWKERNSQGQLVKNGQPMVLEMLYYDRASERFYTIYQEDLRKVGITLNLRYVTPETAFKLLDDQQFDMFGVSYGGGGPFPTPAQFFNSAQADQKASTNITGFKDKHVDELLDQYEKELDVHKRAAILRELDGIVTAQHHYLLEWYAPFQRMVYWNKFGQPKGVITRIGDYRDPVSMWWIDPEKNRVLEEALRDPSKKLAAGAAEDKYWLDFAKVEEQQNAAQSGK
jgi:microcin C transport system substrate-binding protein